MDATQTNTKSGPNKQHNKNTRRKTNAKKALREVQTLCAGCSKVEPKNFAPPQPPLDAKSPCWL